MSAAGHSRPRRRQHLVIVVASLGGPAALATVLGDLPQTFPVPVLVVQHGRLSDDPAWLVNILGRATALPVHIATSDLIIGRPGATVIPGGHHATIESAGRLNLTEDPTQHGGDVLMTSAAETGVHHVTGVVLTGQLDDGTQGARMIKHHGGRVIVQDPLTARAEAMPSGAIAAGSADLVLPLHSIGPALQAMITSPDIA